MGNNKKNEKRPIIGTLGVSNGKAYDLYGLDYYDPRDGGIYSKQFLDFQQVIDYLEELNYPHKIQLKF